VWFGARRLDLWGETSKTLRTMLRAYCPGETSTKVEDAPLGLPGQDKSDAEFQATLQKNSGKRAWRRDWRSTAPAQHRRRGPG
jgi:hypothetical protein